MDLEQTLQSGIDAAEAGQKNKARSLLTDVAEADPANVEAWVWLSQVVDSLEDKAACLENILTLDPGNEFAQSELDRVKATQQQLFAPTYPSDIDEPRPLPNIPEAAKQPITVEYPYNDEFDDEWLCPYCLSPTQPAHRQCPVCRNPLISRQRIQPDRTVWLWRGIFLQITLAVFLAAFAISAFVVLGKLNGISNSLLLTPAYVGFPVNQPTEQLTTMLTLFPLWLFWAIILTLFYTLGLTLLLSFRLPYGHFIYLINAGLMLLGGIFGIILFSHSLLIIFVGITAVFAGALQLLITLNLWNDFTFNETRIQLKIDSGVKNHQTLFISGRQHGQAGLWGLAVIHLRRAVSQSDKNPVYLLALIQAYLRVKRFDLAEQTLQQAESQVDPVKLADLHRQLTLARQ